MEDPVEKKTDKSDAAVDSAPKLQELTQFDEHTLEDKFKKIKKSWDELRPKEDDFVSIYSPEEVEIDKKWIESVESREQFAPDKSEAALIAEYGLAELIESEAWFGSEMHIAMTSKYDDYNGTDFIIQFESGGKTHRIALDIKTIFGAGKTAAHIQGAIARSQENIMKSGGNFVKYHIDPDTDELQKGIRVPCLVVILDSGFMRQFVPVIAMKPTDRSKKRILEVLPGGRRVGTSVEQMLKDLKIMVKTALIADCEEIISVIKSNSGERIPAFQWNALRVCQSFIECLNAQV